MRAFYSNNWITLNTSYHFLIFHCQTGLNVHIDYSIQSLKQSYKVGKVIFRGYTGEKCQSQGGNPQFPDNLHACNVLFYIFSTTTWTMVYLMTWL